MCTSYNSLENWSRVRVSYDVLFETRNLVYLYFAGLISFRRYPTRRIGIIRQNGSRICTDGRPVMGRNNRLILTIIIFGFHHILSINQSIKLIVSRQSTGQPKISYQSNKIVNRIIRIIYYVPSFLACSCQSLHHVKNRCNMSAHVLPFCLRNTNFNWNFAFVLCTNVRVF